MGTSSGCKPTQQQIFWKRVATTWEQSCFKWISASRIDRRQSIIRWQPAHERQSHFKWTTHEWWHSIRRRIQQFFKRWRWWSTKRWQPRRKGSFARYLQLRQEEVSTLHFYFYIYYYFHYISPLKVQIHNNLKMPNERDREDQDSLYREEEEGGES